MFEDSTFHSSGILPNQTPKWMLLALAFNLTLLTSLVVLPLLYPEGLPSRLLQHILYAPTTPITPTTTRLAPPAAPRSSSINLNPLQMPTRIPTTRPTLDPGPPTSDPLTSDLGPGSVIGADGPTALFRPTTPPTVRPAPPKIIPISSITAQNILISQTRPVYPPIAIAARVSGTVVLAATISKSGTIENLRVVSGHPMLLRAALDAVRAWRYKPYLLNDQPVEVETTVNVIFSLGDR